MKIEIHESWYADGQIKSRGEYKNGKQHGVRETWHFNGKKESRGLYVFGKRHGLYEWWHSNGRLESSFTYNCGKWHLFYSALRIFLIEGLKNEIRSTKTGAKEIFIERKRVSKEARARAGSGKGKARGEYSQAAEV